MKSVGIVLLLVIAVPAFAIHPYKDYVTLPAKLGMSYDSLNIVTQDHARLTGWYCKPQVDTSHLVVILAGGDAGNMSYDLPLAHFITQNFSVPVLLFDYRGFGSSDAFAYDSNAIGHPEYLTDFNAVVSYTQLKYPGKKIIIYGRSLGGALALVEGSLANGITGVIAESPYVSQDSLANHYKAALPVTIQPIRSDSLEPWKHVKNFCALHLLVMHGAVEKFILWGELQAFVNAVPIADKKLMDFPGCDHMELPIKATQQFGDALAEFFAKCS